MGKSKGIKLRLILGILVTASVLIAGIVGGYVAFTANLTSLSSNYLESNYQYAKKLSSSTANLLNVMQANMNSIAKGAGENAISQKELDIWYYANEQYYNSIVIVDTNRRVQVLSPNTVGVAIGTKLTSTASLQAVELNKPLISEPYVSITGRLIVMISAPIFNDQGDYLGFVGGTIYLEEDNVLSRLLNDHFYGNGSYVYVADKMGHLIFHPEPGRVNEIIIGNEVINKAVMGQSGSNRVTNSKGKSFFAGYAYEPHSGWGIVSQTPTSVLDKPLEKLLWSMILQALPILLIILAIAWIVSRNISNPLHILAKFSEEAFLSKRAIPPTIPRIVSMIYEVKQLHYSMGNYLNLLSDEIQIDGLTGLSNRKTFNSTIHEWLDDGIPFSFILMDIDHFKLVNDHYGHAVGDEVLIYLASQIQEVARPEDLCFRYGGEEFGILVKFLEPSEAFVTAERLRKSIATTISPSGEPITVSIGIAKPTDQMRSPKEILEMADHALYQSKGRGRNRTSIYANKDNEE
ncbi:diguanylate cyclase (GGDEF)-like protein [Paenibacillus sp. DS2015]|uniref:sensor domain-containing diguanylate cyclase n=1 Tax=Paenibacillus sp. DS2015 TaxID=3373917 RepID=UPI003D1F761C